METWRIVGVATGLLLWGACHCGGGGSECTPTTCEAAGAQCGTVPDGCGGTLDCGYCAPGLDCGGDGRPNVCARPAGCIPATCQSARASCGTLPDGCGGEMHCGYCRAGQLCGGGGRAGACGTPIECSPPTCTEAGAECGRLPDGCGGVLDCSSGRCSEGTCGGGGPNRCGEGSCAPRACGPMDCGLVSDGCAGVLDCGGCAGGLVCRAGQCVDAASSVGGPCRTHDDCGSGTCLFEGTAGFPEGYCSAPCGADDVCGAGNHCTRDGYCATGCSSDAECTRSGYLCIDRDGDGRTECAPAGTGRGAVGTPCRTVAECSGGAEALCLPTPGGMCTVTCIDDADCPAGTACSYAGGGGGVCLPACTTSDACRPGYVCTDDDGDGRAECVPGREIGAPCEDPASCLTGDCVTQSVGGAPGGFCTQSCDAGTPCPAGSTCVVSGPSTGRCLPRCTTDVECRSGYACVGGACQPYGSGPGNVGDPCASVADCAGGERAQCVDGQCTRGCEQSGECPPGTACKGGRCVIACSSDAECRPGEVCDTTTGECVGGGKGAAGSPCQSDAECNEGLCYDEARTGYRGGYCTGICTPELPCSAGGHCGLLAMAEGTPVGRCFGDCSADADCRSGYRCYDGDGDGVSECLPYGGGAGAVGDACTTIDQCQGGEEALCSVPPGFPAGYCSYDCSASPCPAGSHCARQRGDDRCVDSVCCNRLVPCTIDETTGADDCTAGYRCELTSYGQICVLSDRRCSPTLACPDGTMCTNEQDGACAQCNGDGCRADYDCYDADRDGRRECWPAAKGTGAVGDPCVRLRDCAGGFVGVCFFEDNGAFVGGYCSRRCDDVPCPAGSVCTQFKIQNASGQVETVSYCFVACNGGGCRPGYTCQVPEGNTEAVCFPQAN